MEQQQQQQKTASRSMSKIMRFLPKATSSVSFQNPPLYSPNKDKRSSEKTHKSNLGKGFSGPLVTLVVPSENRRKLTKNDPTFTLKFEPTSPRVSCMGQVKCKHYRKAAAGAKANTNNNKPAPNKVSRATSYTPERTYNKEIDHLEKAVAKVDPVVVKNKKKLGLRSIFGLGSRKSDATNDKSKPDLIINNIPKGPCLSTMKRFSSGRDAFTNFDWTTQVAPLDSSHRNYFTDDEKDRGSDGEGDDQEVKMPSSAPVIARNKDVCDDNFVRVGGVSLEPRKEINLWKRRTMAQPQPLQLHVN